MKLPSIFLAGFLFLITSTCYSQSHYNTERGDSTVISLWKSTPPFAKNEGPEKYEPDKGDGVIRLTNVTNPTITVYQSGNGPKATPRPAVIICPGGGYYILAMNLEGTEIASWLESLDIVPVLLKYRVPNNRKGAYADAQRAMSILRSRADEFNINPDKIGIMGFSAGGHLATRMGTHFKQRIYDPIDKYDKASLQPNFDILIYPAYLTNKQNKVADEVQPGSPALPFFIVQTEDDPIGYQNSLFLYHALAQQDVPAELHLFSHGGHGYGRRIDASNSLSTWPDACAAWLKANGIISQNALTEQ